jgi:methyl-accepting chemotaxis protein
LSSGSIKPISASLLQAEVHQGFSAMLFEPWQAAMRATMPIFRHHHPLAWLEPASAWAQGPSQMHRLFSQGKRQDDRAKVDAIMRSQAVIEFRLDGTIIGANEHFLSALGYELGEIMGKHHRMFVDPQWAKSAEYRQFWSDLAAGKFHSATYRRIGKGGREVWIQASYNPVFDKAGRPIKIIKFATDITRQKNEAADHAAQVAAISRALAVIEFDLQGFVLEANENCLKTLGYELDEIVGKHHRMFCDPAYAQSADYAKLWERLRAGEYVAAEFQRFGKGGKEIWIQASYNPVLDAQGQPV